MPLVPLKTYVEGDVAEAVARLAVAQARSESAIIAEAIRTRLIADSEEVVKAQEASIKRLLNRIEARVDKVVWEQTQVRAALLLFVHVWLKHNPPLDANLEESASMSAEARYTRFIDALANELSGGGDELSERLNDLGLGEEIAEAAP